MWANKAGTVSSVTGLVAIMDVSFLPAAGQSPAQLVARTKKADVVEHPDEVFDHVGLLVNEPPATARLPFA